MRPDWAIYWTLGSFSKPLETIILSKSPIFLGNFCKDVKIFNFSSEIIFGQLLYTFGDFLLVTLGMTSNHRGDVIQLKGQVLASGCWLVQLPTC